MDEQRVQSYIHLIEQLINCSNGKGSVILQQNKELIDDDFLQTANQHAQKLQENEEVEASALIFRLIPKLTNGIYPTESKERHEAYNKLTFKILNSENDEKAKIILLNNPLVDEEFLKYLENMSKAFEKLKIEHFSTLYKYLAKDINRILDFKSYSYIPLVGNLLKCSNDKEIYELLNKYPSLVNFGLIEFIQGALSVNSKDSRILRRCIIIIRHFFICDFPPDSRHILLVGKLMKVKDNNIYYQVLSENLYLIDNCFIQAIILNFSLSCESIIQDTTTDSKTSFNELLHISGLFHSRWYCNYGSLIKQE